MTIHAFDSYFWKHVNSSFFFSFLWTNFYRRFWQEFDIADGYVFIISSIWLECSPHLYDTISLKYCVTHKPSLKY